MLNKLRRIGYPPKCSIDGDVVRVIEAKPHHTKLKNEHIEGCCFAPDGLLATSERRAIFLFTDLACRGK
jgi:hypothetical protein